MEILSYKTTAKEDRDIILAATAEIVAKLNQDNIPEQAQVVIPTSCKDTPLQSVYATISRFQKRIRVSTLTVFDEAGIEHYLQTPIDRIQRNINHQLI